MRIYMDQVQARYCMQPLNAAYNYKNAYNNERTCGFEG